MTASLFFYGWWNPSYLLLLIGSIVANFTIGRSIITANNRRSVRKILLIIGVTGNLAAIAYYKYANFFLENIALVFDSTYHFENIILPLAISFFTFQQIAYLVDCYRDEVSDHSFARYCLFVTFFPQLIAGPIVHHKEMLPQFAKKLITNVRWEGLAIGATIFVLGLFKKVILADNLAIHATPVFAAADQGVAISMIDAWVGTLAYSLQLYFDFSGYSDMAIGIARMFGIVLPLNFNSPYKAYNIIDFWHRWHMTLSRFLRDYLYFALGGNRKGKIRRYTNLMLTMLLGGLWHGAGWTFVIWGGLHGLYLVTNHFWHAVRATIGWTNSGPHWTDHGARLLTFVAVAIGWVFFRAESVGGATNILQAMFGLGDANLSVHAPTMVFPFISITLLIAWYAPNVSDLLSPHGPALEWNKQDKTKSFRFVHWPINRTGAVILGGIFSLIVMNLTQISEFLYFQF